ncbi:microcephalin isoform X3 [Hemicordylus capensis]|uniref:microcephalin isoform X3 n=1 Tax=Hemicordylus capensis TaxID=884348 RepID=UPI0023027A1A|nr:microcephalin isoform X3 [Hemicordylus capensis]
MSSGAAVVCPCPYGRHVLCLGPSGKQPSLVRIPAGVVAYVEVWSSSRTENYSKAFAQQLLDMGAKVSKSFSKQVTHVIFKEGHLSTWNRAQKTGVKLVSVLWVEKCRETGSHVNEALYPAVNTNEGLPHLIKKHKCMQPKDYVEKTPENDKKLQRRLEMMTKDLHVQKAATETDIPVLLFEDDGSLVYSPASKLKYQCTAMERRIKDMKEKRENLSLTASQMSQVSDSNSVPTEHEATLVSTRSTCTLSERDSSDPLNSSFTDILGNSESKRLRKESTKCMLQLETTAEMTTATLASSPACRGDCRHLKKRLILPNDLESDFLAKKTNSEMLSQKQSYRDDWYTARTEKSVHLEIAEGTNNNHLNSEKGSGRFSDVTFSTLTTDYVSINEQQKKPRRRSSIEPSTSALCVRDSHNDFLQAILTPVKSPKDQDYSYEDYFSPTNFNTNKIRVSLPSQCLQKSPRLSKMVCEYSPSSKQKAKIQEPNEKGATSSKKRKRVSEINESAASSDSVLAPSPQNKKSATLNMSQREKGTILETSDCHLNLSIQKKNCTTNVNGCSPRAGNNTFSICDIKESSCEPFHDLKNEPKQKLKKAKGINKPSRTLVMTSMCSEKQNAVIQVVKKLGGFLFSDQVCKNTSHVIAGSPRRTLNVLMGIARGCWIVCYEWVLWSLEYGHWISEEPYELSVDFPAAPICRLQCHLSNKRFPQKLFSAQPKMFISRNSQPSCEKLCELVELCGGRVCKTLHQAKVCIGEYRVGKHSEILCLSEKWILEEPSVSSLLKRAASIFPC